VEKASELSSTCSQALYPGDAAIDTERGGAKGFSKGARLSEILNQVQKHCTKNILSFN
jgi:hypothetical protein